MGRPRTATFALGRYNVHEDAPLDGICELPEEGGGLNMSVMPGNTRRALASILHETAHAGGVPYRCLHKERDVAEDQARLLWNMGWRRGE